jgi:PPOX class probable F420-dependent enzyme
VPQVKEGERVSEEEREAFLNEPNVAVLASVGARGRAHAAPIWYLYEEGVFIINTDRGSQKHRNIERNPEVTLVVDRRTPPYYAVMAQGRAEIGPPFADEARLRLAVRYLGEELGRRFVESVPGGGSLSIRLRPRKFIVFDARAGRPQDR